MRTKQTIVVAGLTIALTIAGVACGSSESGKPSVPDRLAAIEGETEDIFDLVPSSRWADISQDVRDIDAAWLRYKRRAVTDGAGATVVARLDRSLAELDAAADGEKGPETAQAANDVSAATVELYGLYDVAMPVDIGRLDVVGRQIILDVRRRDLGAAGTQVEKAVSIWKGGLRDDVVGHEGSAVAHQTDATLTAIDQAVARGDGDSVTKKTNEFLELVDGMERLY